MSKMIQIRNVPDDVHQKLKVRAAQQGMSLSDYVKRELLALAMLPTVDEVLERASRREPINVTAEQIVDIIRSDRGD
jgi:plasmid stability protein